MQIKRYWFSKDHILSAVDKWYLLVIDKTERSCRFALRQTLFCALITWLQGSVITLCFQLPPDQCCSTEKAERPRYHYHQFHTHVTDLRVKFTSHE